MEEYKTDYLTLLKKESDRGCVDISGEAVLPDAYADIRKILSSHTCVVPESASFEEDRAEYAGELSSKILYVTDTGKVRSAGIKNDFEERMPYTGSGEESGWYAPYAASSVGRAQNPRRILLKTRLNPGIEIFEKIPASPLLPEELTEAEKSAIEKKTETVSFRVPAEIRSETFESGDDLSVPEGYPEIADLVFYDLSFGDVNAVPGEGSVSLSGNMKCSFLYTDSEEALYLFTKTVPFSETVPAPDITPASCVSAKGYAVKFSVSPAENPGGEMTVLETDVSYFFILSTVTDSEAVICKDLFSESYETLPQIKKVYVFSDCETVRRELPLSFTAECEADRIIGALSSAYACEMKNGMLEVRAQADIYYVGKDGKTACKTAFADLSSEFPEGDVFYGSVYSEIDSVSYEAGTVHLNGRAVLSGLLLSGTEKEIAVSLENLGKRENNCRSSVLIYYPEDGETLWDVAKKYCVSPERMMVCNRMENEELQGKALLIPKNRIPVATELV